MCTAITMHTLRGNAFLGRTMDFSYALDPELYAVPRGHKWNNQLKTHKINNLYSFMGIGQDISPVTFADGVNEKGFAAAVLYFPGYARYDPIAPQDSDTPAVTALELVKFLLGTCASVGQAASMLPSIRIVGAEDSITNSVAPLHWIIADKSGACMTVEKTAEGLQLMDNPVGVLSNSPDFQWHMTNLRNYMNIIPYQMEEKEWGSVKLSPFGQGAGAFGLPGDYTPPSRFVRAAYQKSHVKFSENRDDTIVACFHIMDTVSIPKGVVMTSRGTSDYTQYTAFLDLTAQEYFFNTYNNRRITCALMPDFHAGNTEIVSLGRLTGPIQFSRQTGK